MRRLSRIYDPIAGLGTERAAGHRQLRFVCQRCCLRTTNPRLSLASPFSTSARTRAEEASTGVKGTQSSEVLDPNEAKYEKSEFKLASTWEGLEWVGTKEWYEARNRPQEEFLAFARKQPLTNRQQLRDELLKAIIEVFSIQRAGREFWEKRSNLSLIESDYHFPRGVRIGCHMETKQPVFHFISRDVQTNFVERLKSIVSSSPVEEKGKVPEKTVEAVAEEFTGAEEISEQEASQASLASEKHVDARPGESIDGASALNPGQGSLEDSPEALSRYSGSSKFAFADLVGENYGKWSSISLKSLNLRFAVAKRVLRRTGVRLTDPQIASSITAGSMYANLWKPEPPKKLAERLVKNKDLARLPNVKVTEHRITYVHKERAIGRWKIIEDELEDRGIPATGRAL